MLIPKLKYVFGAVVGFVIVGACSKAPLNRPVATNEETELVLEESDDFISLSSQSTPLPSPNPGNQTSRGPSLVRALSPETAFLWTTDQGTQLFLDSVRGPNSLGGIYVAQNAALDGGGTIENGFMTHPPFSDGNAGHWIRGHFSLILPPGRSQLVTNVGLGNGAVCGDGVLFKVAIFPADGPGETIANLEIARSDNSTLSFVRGKRALTADLTPWAGKSVEIRLRVDNRGNSDCDHAIWETPVIVAIP